MSNWYERWVQGVECPECGGVGHTGGSEMDDCPECTQKRTQADLEELQSTFNLIWKAQQRAIQMWQQKTGQSLKWPDKASLIVWLMEENESLRKQCDNLMQELADIAPREAGCTCPILQVQGSSCPLHGFPSVPWSDFCKDDE